MLQLQLENYLFVPCRFFAKKRAKKYFSSMAKKFFSISPRPSPTQSKNFRALQLLWELQL
jgi:hypothetical protein